MQKHKKYDLTGYLLRKKDEEITQANCTSEDIFQTKEEILSEYDIDVISLLRKLACNIIANVSGDKPNGKK